jgi:hypothetical protein
MDSMRQKNVGILTMAISAAVLCGSMLASVPAIAQSSQDRESKHRQGTKNTWRNVGIGSAALGVVGLVKHNNTLMLAGAAGALYSASRYEHDRKSQSKTDRARASRYSRKSYTKNGHRYIRKTVYSHGVKSYRFVRG